MGWTPFRFFRQVDHAARCEVERPGALPMTAAPAGRKARQMQHARCVLNAPAIPRRHRLFTFLLMISLDSASNRPLQHRNTPVETCGTPCCRCGGFPRSVVRLLRCGGAWSETWFFRPRMSVRHQDARHTVRVCARGGASSRIAGRTFDNLVKRRRRPAPSPVQDTDGPAWR